MRAAEQGDGNSSTHHTSGTTTPASPPLREDGRYDQHVIRTRNPLLRTLRCMSISRLAAAAQAVPPAKWKRGEGRLSPDDVTTAVLALPEVKEFPKRVIAAWVEEVIGAFKADAPPSGARVISIDPLFGRRDCASAVAARAATVRGYAPPTAIQ